MPNDLVLLTGGTGHIGFRILTLLLENAFSVRAVVRSDKKAETLRSSLEKTGNADKLSKLSTVVVPVFADDNAFNVVVEGVNYIIHAGSPLGSEVPEDGDYSKHFIEPAVGGTLGLLQSASKISTVKRVVITSSFAAILPLGEMFGQKPSSTEYNAENRLPEMKPPFDNSIVAYTAGKIAALNRAEEWVRDHRPGFDVIHIFPSFVYGRDQLCTSTAAFQNSTNRIPLNIALGKSDPQGITAMPDSYHHINDCAKVHVLALNPKIKGNQGFIVSSTGREGMTWDDTKAIVAKRFPHAVASGVLPNNGSLSTVPLWLNVGKTEETFGFKHASYEDMVISVVEHYLELLELER